MVHQQQKTLKYLNAPFGHVDDSKSSFDGSFKTRQCAVLNFHMPNAIRTIVRGTIETNKYQSLLSCSLL